jgi:hypothetical protein
VQREDRAPEGVTDVVSMLRFLAWVALVRMASPLHCSM